MTTVLVTGAGQRLNEVVDAVRGSGAEITVVDDPGRLSDSIDGRTFDAYIQLPVAMTPGDGSVVSRIEHFLSEGLLNRFRAADQVLPTLAPSATVVLVGGQTNVDVQAPDDHEARTALMRVLAHAMRAERAPERLVVRTADPSWSAADIAAQVNGEKEGPGSAAVDDAAGREAIGKAYADWRTEVLGLVRFEF